MTIKELLIEADAIQVGVVESDWQRVIKLAARPLEAKAGMVLLYRNFPNLSMSLWPGK